MEFFDTLANDEHAPYKYEFAGNHSLKLKGRPSPISISKGEAAFIHDFILKHNIKNCFEICTGWGLASIAMGLALKQTGGFLATMDAYIECYYDHPNFYIGKEEVYLKSVGLDSVKHLIKRFELNGIIKPIVGWTPKDVPKALNLVFNPTELLDFVLIDASHQDNALIKDINIISRYLNKKYAVFIHDCDCHSQRTLGYIEGKLDGELKILHHLIGHNLGYITNLE